jgi:hypothetical protein
MEASWHNEESSATSVLNVTVMLAQTVVFNAEVAKHAEVAELCLR